MWITSPWRTGPPASHVKRSLSGGPRVGLCSKARFHAPPVGQAENFIFRGTLGRVRGPKPVRTNLRASRFGNPQGKSRVVFVEPIVRRTSRWHVVPSMPSQVDESAPDKGPVAFGLEGSRRMWAHAPPIRKNYRGPIDTPCGSPVVSDRHWPSELP